MLAWQTRRGARHNAYSVNPKGPAQRGIAPPSEVQRSDWPYPEPAREAAGWGRLFILINDVLASAGAANVACP